MRRILLSLLALLLVGAVAGWFALTRPFPPDGFVADAPALDAALYDGAPDHAPLLAPFRFAIDPMQRLLLANFTGDPDSVYVGFEPQAFADPVHGTGLLVLGWRTDGRVDVFHSPGLALDSATYGIAGDGLGAMVERPFTDARFTIDDAGPDLELTFDDLLGRRVRLRVKDQQPGARRPIGLLAPMGAAASNPPALPLVLLHAFDFVRVSGSDVLLTIDDRFHRLDRLPLRLNGARRWFTRYSPEPFIVRFSPAFDGVLAPLAGAGARDRANAGRAVPAADWERVTRPLPSGDTVTELRSLTARSGARAVTITFAPALPQLTALRDGARAEGAFRIASDSTLGTVTGTWQVTRAGDTVRVVTEPRGGWTPNEPNRTVRLIYRLGGVFTVWPASYRYEAVLTPGDEGAWRMRAGWERVGVPR
jgi:hypothetical protein